MTTPTAPWSAEDIAASMGQGWSIFAIAGRSPEIAAQTVNGQPYGHRPFELQAVVEEAIFADDAAAWAFVRAQAAAGDALARRAAEFLKTASPQEYAAVFG